MEIIGHNLERTIPQILVQDKDHPISDYQEGQIVAVEGENHEIWIGKIEKVQTNKNRLKLHYYDGMNTFPLFLIVQSQRTINGN